MEVTTHVCEKYLPILLILNLKFQFSKNWSTMWKNGVALIKMVNALSNKINVIFSLILYF